MDGLEHINWRIRQCSIELLGHLLSQMAGANVDVNLRSDVDEEQTVNVITSDMSRKPHHDHPNPRSEL